MIPGTMMTRGAVAAIDVLRAARTRITSSRYSAAPNSFRARGDVHRCEQRLHLGIAPRQAVVGRDVNAAKLPIWQALLLSVCAAGAHTALQSTHVTDDNMLILIHHLSRKLMQGICPAARDLAMNALGLALMTPALAEASFSA